MGAWGTGIFENDTALDVKGEYLEMIAQEDDNSKVLNNIKESYGYVFDSDDIDESTFWVALALTQCEVGRLDEEVKDKALEFIDSGKALGHWIELTEEGDPLVQLREKALLETKEKILRGLNATDD